MGNNSIVIILLIACGLYPQRIWAQQYMEVNYGQANVNTVAPTSASMIKFIDHPVSTFTGTPAISHTLFTLRDNQIEIPITLSYCASGIKVSEEASWVGMGWNLSVGGLVVQNVVGDLDRTSEWQNTRNSLLNRLQQVHTINGYSGISCQGQDMNNYDTFYNNAVQGKYQPDVFYYSYPGGSGKFCLDIRNDSICVLDRSHGDIIKMYERETDNQSPSEWIVTAPDGTLHNFTYACRDIADCNPLQITGRTWSLTSSYLPNGQIVDYYYAESIHNAFQYKTHIDIFSDPNSQYYRRWNDGNCPSDATYHTRTVKQVHEILLDSIATDNYVIIFQKSDRADYQNGQRLDDIFIRSRSGDCFRHFHFDYRYVESMTSDIGWMNVINHYGLSYPAECAGSRLFLESVCEVDSLGNCSDRLSFEYNEPERLPYKTSYAMDYWGYYNGILSNQTLIPDLTNLFAGNGQYNDLFMASFPTANRCCDTIAVTTGMLKSILYPTGGKTVYDYESNTYEANIFSRITSQGTQTSQEPTVVSETMIKDNNGSCSLPSSVRMFVDNGQSIILSATLSRGLLSWDELNDAAIVLVTDAPVVKRDTFNISDETVPFVTQQISFKATYPIWVTAYVSLPDAVGDQSLAMSGHASIEGVVRIIETPTTSNEQTTTEPFSGYNYGGGVRVREISHYESEETPTPTLREIYRYEGGKLNVPIDFCRKFVNQKYAIMKIMDYTGEIFTYDYTFTEIEGNLIPTIIVDMTNDIHIDWKEAYCQVSTIVCDNVYCSPYAFNASEVSYDRCTVYMDGNGRSLGRKVYEYYNNGSAGSSSSGTPQVNSGYFLNGQLKQYAVYDASDSLMSIDKYNYNIELTNTCYGISSIDNFNAFPNLYLGVIGGNSGFSLADNYPNTYTYASHYDNRIMSLAYPIQCGRALLSSHISQVGKTIMTERYAHDEYGQISRIDRTRSDGRCHSIIYRYAYNFGEIIYWRMTDRNMISQPIEILESVDGRIVKGQLSCYMSRNTYGSHSGLQVFLPKSVYRLELPPNGISEDERSGMSSSAVNRTYYPNENLLYSYDEFNNIRSILENGQDEAVYLWSYHGAFPVAKIEGLSYQRVSEALSETFITTLANSSRPSEEEVNTIRTMLDAIGGLVTTYTYKPLLGMTSQTLPNGVTTQYEYDSFGRLKMTIDGQGKPADQLIYNYGHAR